MRNKIIGLSLSCILIFLSFQCRQEKKPPQEVNVAPLVKPFEGIPSVCLHENASVMSEPAQKGKLISALSLGEKVLFMGEEKLDSGDKKYLRIKLSDAKEGWVSENYLSIDAKPAVTICRTIIYLRPDPVTITDKEFGAMNFVAISKPENEWCEAKGQEGIKTGWIKSIYTSVKDEDITVALLANKALAETNKDKKKEKLTAIINNPSFSNSIFMDTLKACLTKIPPWDDDEEPIIDEPDESDEVQEGE